MSRRYHANDSSAMASMLAPTKPAQEKDYVHSNIRRIADVEHVAVMRRALAEVPASPPKHSSKYEDVTSKLAATGALSHPAPAARRAAAAEDDAGDYPSASARPARGRAAVESVLPTKFERTEIAPRKPAVPTRDTALPKPRHEAKDFVGLNASSAVVGAGYGGAEPATASARCSTAGSGASAGARGFRPAVGSVSGASAAAAAAASAAPKHSAGEVPRYLKERQAEWAAVEAAKRKAEEDKDIPPGMRVMPDAERTDMLAMLREGIAEAKEELSKFRLVTTVPSQLRKKTELEGKLAKMEEAVHVFSRERVFVKLDA